MDLISGGKLEAEIIYIRRDKAIAEGKIRVARGEGDMRRALQLAGGRGG